MVLPDTDNANAELFLHRAYSGTLREKTKNMKNRSVMLTASQCGKDVKMTSYPRMAQ
jgi:hypothetical protein